MALEHSNLMPEDCLEQCCEPPVRVAYLLEITMAATDWDELPFNDEMSTIIAQAMPKEMWYQHNDDGYGIDVITVVSEEGRHVVSA